MLTVLLCGCGKTGSEKADVCADFQADFTADYRGLKLGGSLISTRQGVCSVTLTAPKSLSGLTAGYKDGEIALLREHVKATADEAYLPDDSFFSLLRGVLRAVGEGKAQACKNGCALDLPQGQVSLTLGDNRLLRSAKLPDADFSVEFFNCRQLS